MYVPVLNTDSVKFLAARELSPPCHIQTSSWDHPVCYGGTGNEGSFYGSKMAVTEHSHLPNSILKHVWIPTSKHVWTSTSKTPTPLQLIVVCNKQNWGALAVLCLTYNLSSLCNQSQALPLMKSNEHTGAGIGATITGCRVTV